MFFLCARGEKQGTTHHMRNQQAAACRTTIVAAVTYKKKCVCLPSSGHHWLDTCSFVVFGQAGFAGRFRVFCVSLTPWSSDALKFWSSETLFRWLFSHLRVLVSSCLCPVSFRLRLFASSSRFFVSSRCCVFAFFPCPFFARVMGLWWVSGG